MRLMPPFRRITALIGAGQRQGRPATRYLDALIEPNTPPTTLTAFLDHDGIARTIVSGVAEALAHLVRLATPGIDLHGSTWRVQNQAAAGLTHWFEAR
jgi:hypothetical protein